MLKKNLTQQAEKEDLFGHGVVWKKRVEKRKGDESLSGTVQARILSDAVGPFPKMFTCMLWIPKGFFFESDRIRILRSFFVGLDLRWCCEQDLRGVELASSHRLGCHVSFAHSQAFTPPGQPVADAGEACGGRAPDWRRQTTSADATWVPDMQESAGCRTNYGHQAGLQVRAVAQLLLGFGGFANHNPANCKSGLARRNPRRLF